MDVKDGYQRRFEKPEIGVLHPEKASQNGSSLRVSTVAGRRAESGNAFLISLSMGLFKYLELWGRLVKIFRLYRSRDGDERLSAGKWG
jgi:hypothetical protein